MGAAANGEGPWSTAGLSNDTEYCAKGGTFQVITPQTSASVSIAVGGIASGDRQLWAMAQFQGTKKHRLLGLAPLGRRLAWVLAVSSGLASGALPPRFLSPPSLGLLHLKLSIPDRDTTGPVKS